MHRHLAPGLATLLLLSTSAPVQARRAKASGEQLQRKVTRLKRQADQAVGGYRFSKREGRRLTQIQERSKQRDSGLYLKIDFHEQRAATLRNQAAFQRAKAADVASSLARAEAAILVRKAADARPGDKSRYARQAKRLLKKAAHLNHRASQLRWIARRDMIEVHTLNYNRKMDLDSNYRSASQHLDQSNNLARKVGLPEGEQPSDHTFVMNRRKSSPRSSHRFHLALKLQPRLQERTRQNVQSVAMYQRPGSRGTAFLVTRPRADGTALVMTNLHVVTKDLRQLTRLSSALAVRGHSIVFTNTDGKKRTRATAAVEELVFHNPAYDCALVKVRLTGDLTRLEPVKLSSAPIRGVDRVYSVGHPALQNFSDRQLARSITGAQRDAFRSKTAPEFLKTIQLGQARSSRSQSVKIAGKNISTTTMNLPGFYGASGSPVFDVRDHKVIGLLHGGVYGDKTIKPGKWTHYVATIKDIRESISTTLMMDQMNSSMKPDHRQLLIEMMTTR